MLCHRFTVSALLLYTFLILTNPAINTEAQIFSWFTGRHPRATPPDLTFAETIYNTLSGACRAIVDIQQSAMPPSNDFINTMKIVYFNNNMVNYFPINAAYGELTQPSMFDITRQTKVIIHGFRDSSQSAVPFDMAQAYDEKNMFNVLMIDSGKMLNESYISSVHNSWLIGKRVANLLANLENFGANAEDFHLLGISLGAHIAGWAGKYFRQYKAKKLGRISGLDPAGPCFSNAYSDQRLDKTDAKYVDVVHSNRLVQGVIEPLGHADFYINGGGPNQPGCIMPSCSHLRAAQVYTESIKAPKSFVGIRCQSWKRFVENSCEKDKYAVLGYGSSTATRGLYYLRTAAKPPFSLGMGGTKNLPTTMDTWLQALNLT